MKRHIEKFEEKFGPKEVLHILHLPTNAPSTSPSRRSSRQSSTTACAMVLIRTSRSVRGNDLKDWTSKSLLLNSEDTFTKVAKTWRTILYWKLCVVHNEGTRCGAQCCTGSYACVVHNRGAMCGHVRHRMEEPGVAHNGEAM